MCSVQTSENGECGEASTVQDSQKLSIVYQWDVNHVWQMKEVTSSICYNTG
jgi:hypothetical protein